MYLLYSIILSSWCFELCFFSLENEKKAAQAVPVWDFEVARSPGRGSVHTISWWLDQCSQEK